MTDQQRAAGLIHAVAGAQSGTEALAVVVAEFAAVRLDERRAIVAWLRVQADKRRITHGLKPMHRSDVMDAMAEIVERGDYAAQS